jgi:hypothetical protein
LGLFLAAFSVAAFGVCALCAFAWPAIVTAVAILYPTEIRSQSDSGDLLAPK